MEPIGEASAPATLSNLGPGFDVLGLALDQPRERIRARLLDVPEVRLFGEGPFGARIPTDPEKNVAAFAAKRVLAGTERGVELTIDKRVPPGSGLGSSASS